MNYLIISLGSEYRAPKEFNTFLYYEKRSRMKRVPYFNMLFFVLKKGVEKIL